MIKNCMLHRSLLFVLILGMAVGCASTSSSKAKVSTPGTLAMQSGEAYHRGLQQLKDSDYAKAFETLQAVARGPSYVRYTALARLRLADILFYQEQYDEAAEAYRGFIELNASDPNLHYAYFRMAESKVKSIASDFFLVPPSDRRDPRRVWTALRFLDDFVARYPDSPFIEQGLVLRSKMAQTVSSYEMEVARFYMTRKKPAGAVARINQLMTKVPSTFREEHVHVALIEALSAAKQDAELSKACTTYWDLFPNGKKHKQVSKSCSSVTTRSPDQTAGNAEGG
ncbi:MAG: outer membrane protein assembly factor BamD [Myxococcota bacterium]